MVSTPLLHFNAHVWCKWRDGTWQS